MFVQHRMDLENSDIITKAVNRGHCQGNTDRTHTPLYRIGVIDLILMCRQVHTGTCGYLSRTSRFITPVLRNTEQDECWWFFLGGFMMSDPLLYMKSLRTETKFYTPHIIILVFKVHVTSSWPVHKLTHFVVFIATTTVSNYPTKHEI